MIFVKRIFTVALLSCFLSGAAQDTTRLQRFKAEGIFSKPSEFRVELKGIYSIISGKGAEAFLTTEPTIFQNKVELLHDVAVHWKAEALEVEISSVDHDTFKVNVLLHKQTFQIKFEWDTDLPLEHKVTVNPDFAALMLDSNKFTKGNIINGHLDFSAHCKGVEFDKTKIHLSGNFRFVVP